MNLDLKAVIFFAHIARTRSFSRSAAELGVAQPWLSARIRRLEARLGCSLFERTTRSVKLTAEGDRLLGAAEMLSLSLCRCIPNTLAAVWSHCRSPICRTSS